VLQKNKLVFALRIFPESYPYFIDTPQFASDYDQDQSYAITPISLPVSNFDQRITDGVNGMKSSYENKFVTGTLSGESFIFETMQDINFFDLRDDLIWGDDSAVRLMFYRFEYEDKERIICLLFSKVGQIDESNGAVITMLKSSLNAVAMPLYPIMSNNYFDLDVLINVGAIPDPEFRIHINNDLIDLP